MSVFKRASQRFSGAEKMLLSHDFVNCFRTKAFRQRRRLIFRRSFTGRFGGFSRSVFSCIRRVRISEEICFHEKTLKNSLSYFLIFSKNMLYRKRLLAKFPALYLSSASTCFRYLPVMLSEFAATASGVPSTTTRPPSFPPHGPMSIM